MKKTLIFLVLFIVFIIIYFLQINFFNWFTIAGVKPNLFIILILVIGLFAGKTIGIGTGIIAGIFLDLFIGKSVGITSIMLGIVGFLGGYLDKKFSKDSRITMILMVILATLIYEVGKYGIYIIKDNMPLEIGAFSKLLFVEIIFNVILTIRIPFRLIRLQRYSIFRYQQTNDRKNIHFLSFFFFPGLKLTICYCFYLVRFYR